MKKLHLLCNAHLDPVWLWQWKEGLAEAISTFRVAADFCEKNDNFIFNHNEALLYEWVEKHEPQLFERIKRLVKRKKWIIIGGWYIQPDCTMLSGESFMEQIRLGHEYFMEKFGVKPTTAVNVDPFGHTRGLVQILKQNGYDSYLFMRPEKMRGDFIWEGFDGSRILAHGIFGCYNTLKGEALNKVKSYIETDKEKDVGLCLWGVGNHGGGPSKIDLDNINRFISESEVKIVHSSAEAYMADIDRNELNVVNKSLGPYFVGCYTTMARVKQANRHLENKIAITEKIMSYADLCTDYIFDKDELSKAKKALAFCQFHDIIPGTAIKSVEDDSLRTFGYGEEIADRLYAEAFFKMCEGQEKAKDGEIPIMVFNPHPYEIEGEFEVGFMLQNQNWNENEQTIGRVYDKTGNLLPTQNEKPECTFELDWIQKICFRGKLVPSSINRFDCQLTVVDKSTLPSLENEGDYIEVSNERMTARISKATGLIELYKVDGIVYVENGGVLEVYRDNEDPWGMNVTSFDDLETSFKLMEDSAVNEFIGYPDENIGNVRIIENGDVRTKIQAFFEYKRTVAVVEYTLPKQGAYIGVDICIYSNTVNKMIKYSLDTTLNGVPYGETAFGVEELDSDNHETVYHKWCGIEEGEKKLYVINNGIYGGSFTNSEIKLSLLRTPIYSAHPVLDRQIAPHNRLLDHIDMGERRFSFRITTDKDVARQSQVYNEAPQLLSFFPSGNGEKKESIITVDNENILMSSMKKNNDKYIINLYNSSDSEAETEISVPILNRKLVVNFGKYELKTIEF